MCIRDRVKYYGVRQVVKNVSINVAQGEIVGLLGPNGAGKTTTFYMMVGFITPTSGRVFLDDEEITRDAMYQRAQKGIGYLPQEPSVFRKLSVEDNIMAVLEMMKMSKEDRKEKLESLLAEFRLQKVRKNVGDSLSGGERRRTEIARSLASEPRFILLDEPFAGIDPIAVCLLYTSHRDIPCFYQPKWLDVVCNGTWDVVCAYDQSDDIVAFMPCLLYTSRCV